MKAKKERTKLQIAKLQGYLDGRISRYVRCQWSDQILENFSQAIGGDSVAVTRHCRACMVTRVC